MSLINLSPDGVLFRQNVQALRELGEDAQMGTQPWERYVTEVHRLRNTLDGFQRTHAKARRDCIEREEQLEESYDRFRQAKTALVPIFEECVTQYTDIRSLYDNIWNVKGPRLLPLPSDIAWADDFAVILKLADASELLDANVKQMRVMQDEAYELEEKYESSRKEVLGYRERVYEIWQEYETLSEEFEEVIFTSTS